MPKKKPERQATHRARLVDAGGRQINVELSAVAVAALQYIKARDNLDTNKQAIEQSLLVNAGMKVTKPD